METESKPQDEKLVKLFRRFDANGDGMIDEDEFGQMLADLHWDSPPEMRSLEFALIDQDADGLVGFQEFADWWLDQA